MNGASRIGKAFAALVVTAIAAAGLPGNPSSPSADAAQTPNAKTDAGAKSKSKSKSKGNAKPQAKPGGEAAAAPAPAEPARYTEHDRLREELEYNRASLAGSYRAHGTHGPWDEEAARFLEQMAVFSTYADVSVHYRDVPAPAAEQLRVAAAGLVAAGCDDALVAYCHAAILQKLDHRKEALDQVKKAIPSLQSTEYPAHRVFAAARLLERLDADGGAGIQAGRLAETYMGQLPVGPLDRTARRLVFRTMRDKLEGLPVPRRVEIVEQLRKADRIDPWVFDVLDGALHVDLAWESRGGGFADSVTPQGWAGFFHHLGLARESLTRAWKLAPDLPEAPAWMINVATGAGDRLGEQVITWFERVEAAQFDYVPAYSRMYAALLPRWGGSHAAMYELGLRAMRTGRYDTVVPWQLVRAAYHVGRDSGEEWGVVRSRPGLYEQLCEVDDGYIAAVPDADKTWFRTHRAGLAWRAGKLAEARKQLDELGDAWVPEAFEKLGSRNPPAAVGQVYAQTGPQAEAVRGAESAMAEGDSAGALRQFEAARTALGQDVGRAAPYFQQRATLLGRRVGLAEGRAVDLQPDAQLTSWKALHGKWRVNEHGELLGRAGGEKHCYLLLEEPVGGRFEVSGRGEPRMHDSPPVVLLCEGEQPLTLIVFFPGTVTLYLRGRQGPMQFTDAAADFVVRVDGDKLSVRRGGKEVMANVQLPPHAVPRRDPRLALAVLNDVGDAAFTGLTVRRITGAAPAEGDGLD